MEFASHEPLPPLTDYELAMNAIVDRLFPEKDKDDKRQLFLIPLQTTDCYQAMQAPGDAEVIRRFSRYEAPSDI